MEIDEKMSRILAITDFYLSRFGRTQVGIFQIPTSDPNPSWFYIFINTLMSALRQIHYQRINFRRVVLLKDYPFCPARSMNIFSISASLNMAASPDD